MKSTVARAASTPHAVPSLASIFRIALLAGLALGMAAFAARSAAATRPARLPFSSVAYPTATQPRSVTIDDVNADTYPDLIVACTGASAVQIFYGTAKGVYGATPDVTLADVPHPQKIVVADFNDDGRKDLAVALYYDGARIYRQDASGAFEPRPTLITEGTFNRCIVAGDIDGDSQTDLAIVSGQSASSPDLGRVTIWMGTGFGWLSWGGSYSTGAPGSDWLSIADLNEDGRLDLAVSNDDPSSTISVLLNTGFSDTRFGAPTQFAVGAGPRTCDVADLNGDGHLDVATANSLHEASVTVLLGAGDGSFAPELTTRLTRRMECDPFAVAAGDLTGDSLCDLAVTGGAMGTVLVLPGNGDGTFGDARGYGAGASVRGIALGDVNRDGRTDIAVTCLESNTVQVLRSDAARGFPGEVFSVDLGNPISPELDDDLVGSLASSDLNGDGHVDVATIHPKSGAVSLAFGSGDGTFGSRTNLVVGRGPQAVVLADLDGDGIVDLATANEGDGNVSVRKGRGDGTFDGPTGYGVSAAPRHLVACDANGDGRPDLVTADYPGNAISLLLGKSAGGGFEPAVPFTAGGGPAWVSAGDLDGDGRLDLVVADELESGFSVLYGTGDASLFGERVFTGTGGAPRSVTVADLDLDGTPEIVVSLTAFDKVEVWKWVGARALTRSSYFETPFEPREATTGDLDQDGIPEIVVAARLGQTYVLRWTPSAPDGRARGWSFGSMGTSVVLADANEDGSLDLVTMNPRGEGVCVLLNDLPGGIAPSARPAPPDDTETIRNVTLYPNPLNPVGTIRFRIERAGPLRVDLFDVQGRLVKTIADEALVTAGEKRYGLDGRDGHGRKLASGVYFYRIESRAEGVTGRFALLE